MSSHHIVKEKQEPALIVDDLNDMDSEHLGQLLEWSPTIIAHEQSAAQLEAHQIKVDLVFPLTDNEYFLKDALSYLVENTYPAVNILSSQIQPDFLYPFLSSLTIVLFQSGKKIYAVKSGFSKWKTAGEYIDILSENALIRHTGLMEITRQRYQTLADGFFQLYFNEDVLLIAEDF